MGVPSAVRVYGFNTATRLVSSLLDQQDFAQAPVFASGLSVALRPFAYNLLLAPATHYLFTLTYMNSSATLFGAVQVADTYIGRGAYLRERQTSGGNLVGVPLTSFVFPTISSDFAFTATFNPAVSTVPYPRTWALMLAGLGAIGVAARRHQRVG